MRRGGTGLGNTVRPRKAKAIGYAPPGGVHNQGLLHFDAAAFPKLDTAGGNGVEYGAGAGGGL